MTLIEVMAGLVLLATLLVALLAAQSRYARQGARAELRMQAITVAEGLLAAWWQDRSKFPTTGQGTVGQQGRQFYWRTRKIENPAVARLGGRVIRLDLWVPNSRPAEPALAAVEVVLPPESQP